MSDLLKRFRGLLHSGTDVALLDGLDGMHAKLGALSDKVSERRAAMVTTLMHLAGIEDPKRINVVSSRWWVNGHRTEYSIPNSPFRLCEHWSLTSVTFWIEGHAPSPAADGDPRVLTEVAG